jgi:hypothetical protein
MRRQTPDDKLDPRFEQVIHEEERTMSKLTSTLQAAVVITAISAPATAAARLNLNPEVDSRPTPVTIAAPAAPPHVQVTPHRSSTAFDWGDAALGAGTTLLIVGAAGAGTASLRTRRRVRPQTSAT